MKIHYSLYGDVYESVSDFNNDEPGRLLFAAVSYMYMYTCTSACNIIRERGEGGGEGESLNDIHNITAFIRHATDRGYKTVY